MKKLMSILLSMLMMTAMFAACGETPDPDPGPVDPGPVGPGPDQPGDDDPVPPAEYVYGDEHADEYDGSYTESLLALGEQDFTRSQLSGTDALGREKKTDSGDRDGRYVGIFYFMWLNEGNRPYDISKMLEEYGEFNLEGSPLWALPGSPAYDESISPLYAFHYFEEPLYGYYASTDKWVIMRHLELLSQAGVDFLYLDFTNANSGNPEAQPNNIYPEATFALMDSILELQAKGIEAPKIVPMVCNPDTGSDQRRGNVVEWVYANYYAKDNFKYRSCWFTADEEHNPGGKPLLITYTIDRNLFKNKAAYDAFWFRKVVWPTQVRPDSYKDGFPWMDYSLPQADYDGVMNVSVAQHIDGHWSSTAYLAEHREEYNYTYRGRGAIGTKRYAYETDEIEDANLGLNFSEQWENVIATRGTDKEPWMVSVTGWNEWIAQKYNFEKVATFVDTFSIAFSRDAEMMRDSVGYADTYYMLLATNAARYKQKDVVKNSATAMWQKQTIALGTLSSWEGVKAKYVDFKGDAMARNKASVGSVYTYTDDSARNDIEYVKIANDEENLYVLVTTKENITPYESGDEGWMNLYLSTGARNGWENYNFVINRHPNGGKTSIEALSTDENGKIVATASGFEAEYFTENNQIAYKIPLKAIGVTSKGEIGLKACDNIFANKKTEKNDGVGVYEFGDVMAFYCGGDCAPLGRLNYAYRMAY